MDDDLFEQLFRLLQSSGPVNWKVAREVTKSLAGEPEPIEPAIAEEYRELAVAAALRIEAATSLPSSPGGELHPTDRATWAADNQQNFRVLIEPLADKLSMGELPTEAASMAAMLQPLGPALLGVQAGTMVGFMSHRVLGQFDTGVPTMDHDRPYLVVPNIEGFAVDHGLDMREARLWAALHESAFHKILAVEWLRGHFVSLMTAYYDSVEFDLAGLMGKLTSLEDPAEIEALIGENQSGMPSLLKAESDPERLAAVQAFTAFVEGYGDYVVRLAGADLLTDLERIEEAYSRRRAEPDQAEQSLQQLAGLDLQRHRARDAALFCAEISRRWGNDALDRIWEDPEHMPNLAEITDPVGWAARVLLE
jgi:putative hydrolase